MVSLPLYLGTAFGLALAVAVCAYQFWLLGRAQREYMETLGIVNGARVDAERLYRRMLLGQSCMSDAQAVLDTLTSIIDCAADGGPVKVKKEEAK